MDLDGLKGGRIGIVPPAGARPVQMLDDDAAHPVDGAIDHGVQIGANVFDGSHGRIDQIDLDAAELVDAAARAVLVAEPHHDTLDSIAAARQRKLQSAPGVVSQRGRDGESQALHVNVHRVLFGCAMRRQR